MYGSFKNDIRHFDPCKNKVPQNFLSNDLKTGYYAHQIFNTPEYEYGRNTSCKDMSDKWDVLYKCSSKWIKPYHIKSNGHYYSSYNDTNYSNSSYYFNTNQNHTSHSTVADDIKGTDICSQQLLLKLKNVNQVDNCDTIIEMPVLEYSSKEGYLAKHFPQSFVKDNRFLCPEINVLENTNVVDNMNQEKFTESNQNALTLLNVKKYISLKLL